MMIRMIDNHDEVNNGVDNGKGDCVIILQVIS